MEEKSRLRHSLVFPVLFAGILWFIRFSEEHFHFTMTFLGIMPRTVEGLIGILTAPFEHGSYDHLLSNTIPLLVVGTGIIYFYKEISFSVITMVWLFTGFWVWLIARPEPHIGASGLIYGFVCFLFFSGIFRKNKNLLAISLLVTFLYGSLAWGILPVDPKVSWESHLAGSISGIFAAIYFRKEGPQSTKRILEDEPEPTGPEYWMTEEQKRKYQNTTEHASEESPTPIHYIYKEKE